MTAAVPRMQDGAEDDQTGDPGEHGDRHHAESKVVGSVAARVQAPLLDSAARQADPLQDERRIATAQRTAR